MINQNLIEEVLRLKDAALMFPQPIKEKRILAIKKTVLPTEKAKTQMEWWLHIINGGNPSSIMKYIKSVEKETPKRMPLTKAHIDTLRALSYKIAKVNVHIALTAQAA